MAYMKKRVSFFMRILLCLIAAGLFICGFYMLVVQYQTATSHIEDVAGQSLQEKQHGRVLFLSSYSQTHFSVPLQWQGIDKGLKGTGVSFDTEYMDMKNHSDPASVERFRDMLAGKLAHTSYDALIVGDVAPAAGEQAGLDAPVVLRPAHGAHHAEGILSSRRGGVRFRLRAEYRRFQVR